MKADLRLTPFVEFTRVFRFLLPALAAIAFFPRAASAQTVDEVIAKNIQAHGGLEKVKSVRSVRTRAKLSAGSFRAAFRQDNNRPDMLRAEFIIHRLAQSQVYDCNTGSQVS